MTTTYRDAATALWAEAGAYAHDTYAKWRARCYPELPDQLPITIGLVPYGHCIGLTITSWQYGPRISIFSPLFGRGRRRVEAVIIHEMLHAWLYVTGQATKHKGEPWYAAVRRLSPIVLGHDLDARRGADRKSVRISNPAHQPGNGAPKTLVRKVRVPDAIQHDDVARWPDAFYPDDYDWGEPLRCPTY